MSAFCHLQHNHTSPHIHLLASCHPPARGPGIHCCCCGVAAAAVRACCALPALCVDQPPQTVALPATHRWQRLRPCRRKQEELPHQPGQEEKVRKLQAGVLGVETGRPGGTCLVAWHLLNRCTPFCVPCTACPGRPCSVAVGQPLPLTLPSSPHLSVHKQTSPSSPYHLPIISSSQCTQTHAPSSPLPRLEKLHMDLAAAAMPGQLAPPAAAAVQEPLAPAAATQEQVAPQLLRVSGWAGMLLLQCNRQHCGDTACSSLVPRMLANGPSHP